ncbi:sigma 54-interacting transcriptional regulator [Sorangium sp. So ce327]|uniref:sigma 54-interacting transcriptional regulator n=1 Tax=Sorangium sp. So ce327 TaxID=3133301 RepID=UPI003F5FA39F
MSPPETPDARSQPTEPIPDGPGPPLGDPALDKSSWVLLVYHRRGAEAIVLHEEHPVVLGREAPSTALVADCSLSREHARITLTGGGVMVDDLGSTNGTWVKGERVRRAELRPGDELLFGSVLASIQRSPAPSVGALGIESHEAFRLALEQEIARARHFGRTLALMMVRAAEKPALHVNRWCARVRARLRPVDRIGLYSSDMLEILLPEASPAQAAEVAESIARDHGDGGHRLLVGTAMFPHAASTPERLLDVCRSAAQSAVAEHAVHHAHAGTWAVGARLDPFEAESKPIVGRSTQAIFEQVPRLAAASIPVLILGETGTGKEVLARAIHERGPRGTKSMVYVNCAAIPEQLVESTLFGHERGAFTGAIQQQRGVLETANGGTLLLDEIGELSPHAQAALLRAIEARSVTRVGSTRAIDIDVRLIAATHRDLEAMCAQGHFRYDLFYRLNVMTLVLPPLRERVDEIEPLARRFLARASRASERSIRTVHVEALLLLQGYAWPGNIRELRNVIERAVVIARADEITDQDLPERIRAAATAGAAPPSGGLTEPAPALASPEVGSVGELKTRLNDYEAEVILAALRAAGGNQTEAARRMGMPLRTFVRKISHLRSRGRMS